MEIQLVSADLDDTLIIASLAQDIWLKHYVPIIGEEQVDYMLSEIYNDESLRRQMEEKMHKFFLVKTTDANEYIGFVSISNENPTDYWIHKFYISTDVQGKGIGTKVFNALKEQMPRVERIRLTVNRQNYKSINFYFKLGFVIEQVADFDIGKGFYMNDFVMLNILNK